jgi:phosphosulfolactate phosphohydrolase-like enzyme
MLCAGTRGRITREDVLFAGAVIDRLLSEATVDESALNDQARIARAAWRDAAGGQSSPPAISLAAELRQTQGGRNLKAIHLEHDIDDAARIDSLHVVPELNLSKWRIE